MATSTPLAYNTGPTIVGTTQIGSLAVGTTNQDYSKSPGGVPWWMGPDQDLGYVIGVAVPGNTQPTPLGGVTASVGFFRSEFLTENSFINLAEYISIQDNTPQTFTGGTQAKTWLNDNGYWTSYSDTWKYNSLANLPWPTNTSGYTLYSGGFNSPDDGFTNVPITSLDNFQMDAQGATNQVYVSTNGYITFGAGSTNIITTPQGQSSPAAVCGNPNDNWLQPGVTMTDGDVQNLYYKTGGSNGKTYVKFIVYGGTYQNITAPTSWLLNYYVDSQYQWVETRVKNTVRGSAGPYNDIDVSQPASTTSQVWRGDLLGQNWTYLGFGSIVE